MPELVARKRPMVNARFRPFPVIPSTWVMMVMFDWLRKKLLNHSPLSKWSVHFRDGVIVKSDGGGGERSLPNCDLRRVVVATDESGPWGADVVFMLYSTEADPVGVFPLEADGRDDFVKWMGPRPGFKDGELAKTMGSTRVAQFDVLVIEPNGSEPTHSVIPFAPRCENRAD